jgi:outer membrane protein
MDMTRIRLASRGIGVLAALAATMWVAGAQAQEAGTKIGVVNFSRLIEQAPQAQAIMQELQAEFAARERSIMAQQRALQEKVETLQRDGQVMGADERLNLERTIRDEQRNLQRAEEVFVEDLNIRRNEETNRLQRTLLEEIQNYAVSGNFDLIVADALFYSDAVDITGPILQALQARQQGSR